MPQKGASSEESAFKNWINAELVKKISQHIRHHYPDFNSKKFEELSKKLPPLELKARTRLITEHLHAHLPSDYRQTLKILILAAEKPKASLEPLSGFDLWPFTEFIQTHGLKHADESLKALTILTQLFTSEFAIRPFLIHHTDVSLRYLDQLTSHPVHHVRRWVSEGTRPRLPWGEQLTHFIKDPTPTVKLLEKLKYDEELYVRKSVANHLNDISKDNPDITIKTLTRWKKEAPSKHRDKIDWITRHALRGLIKKGHPKALQLIGVNTGMSLKIRNFKLDKKSIKVGDKIHFEFEIESKQKGLAVIDYVIHYRKARGESGKVFKLTTKNLKPQEWVHIAKAHSFKPVTTRVLYPGTHHVEVLANGKSLGKIPFTLKVPG